MLRQLATQVLPPGWRLGLGAARARLESRALGLPVIGRSLRRKRFRALESIPTQLNIEVTSICNAQCIMCPRHEMDRPMELMPFDLFRKVVDDGARLGVKRYALNGYGELFTARKDYRTYVNYVADNVPGARIIINSNGSLLDEEAARFLIDKKVDSLNVDIDGATKETFEKVRLNLRYDVVVKNVKRLLELRKELGSKLPKVRVGMIRQPANEHEVDQFLAQWRGVADFVSEGLMVNRGGSIAVDHAPDVDRPCWLIWSEFDVWSNGDVVLCCDDWNCAEVMGSLKTQTIREVWQGEKFRRYRELHRKGRGGEISLCGQCSYARHGPAWFQKHVRA